MGNLVTVMASRSRVRAFTGLAVAFALSCTIQGSPPDPTRSSSAAIEGNGTNHGDTSRSGVYSDPILTTANVQSPRFGLVGQYQVDGPIHAQPFVIDNPRSPDGANGPKELLVVATTHNNLYLFDADRPGTPPYATVGPDKLGAPVNLMGWPLNPCGNISWDGILSTPVVVGNNLFFVSVTSVTLGGKDHLQHKMYALDLMSCINLDFARPRVRARTHPVGPSPGSA